MDRDQLKNHLQFAAELGVAGVSRDPAWRVRGQGSDAAGSAMFAPAPPGRLAPESAGDSTDEAPERARPSPAVQVSRNAAEALSAVRADIGDCTRCKLHAQGRKQIVFGVGNPNADLMFVGEAPGADEDLQGIPFVGRAGQLLTRIIAAIDLTREDVYIANVIKCRPPGNRNPEQDEVETCEPFLFQQIDIIKPKVIVALGSRVGTGRVIEQGRATEPGIDVKPVRQILDAEAFVPPDVIDLARWTAEYYAAGVGDAIPALLPPMARGGRVDAHKTTRVAAITAAGIEVLAAAMSVAPAAAGPRPVDTLPAAVRLTSRQRDALD